MRQQQLTVNCMGNRLLGLQMFPSILFPGSGLTWAYCSLRNEMEKNEMKINSSRNDHVVSRYVSSDILKKLPFRQENLDWVECVTATGSKAISLFTSLDATKFVLISVITLIEMICPKIWTKPRPKTAQKSLLVAIELLVLTGNAT